MCTPNDNGNTSQALQDFQNQLYHHLLHDHGMQQILSTSYQYLNHSITLCDASFRILETHPLDFAHDSLESKDGKQFLSLHHLKIMESEKLTDLIYSTDKAFIFKSTFTETTLIFCPIRIGHAVTAYISILSIHQDIHEKDLDYVNILAGILSLEMQKASVSNGPSYSLTQLQYLFTDLVERPISQPQYYRERFAQFGYPLHDYTWFLIFYPKVTTSFSPMKLRRLQAQLQNIFPTCLPTYYNNTLTLLLSKDQLVPFTESEEKKLLNFLKFNGYIGLLSYRCSRLEDLYRYYQQTYHAIFLDSFQNASQTDESLLSYDLFSTEVLFDQCKDPLFLKTTIHPDLLYLQDYDKKHRNDLFNTLRCYLQNNRQAKLAAQDLHIHKSTFFYRLNKITELLDLSLDDYIRLYNYELSFKLIDYLDISNHDAY